MAAAVAVAVGEALTVKLLEFVWVRAALRVPSSILVLTRRFFFFFFACCCAMILKPAAMR
jgi:hypothetical protein